MPFDNVKISILFGSQTGNAQDLAERIWRESKRFFFQSVVKPLDEYNVEELVQERCVVLVCSTTGQGDEPDNMKTFWRFLLRRSLPTNLLCNLRFAVLGLGDSSYAKFNFVAKRLQKRIIQLGGEPLIPLGLGDDQHDLGYNFVADKWIDNLWVRLVEEYPLPTNIQPLPKNLPIIPRWNVTKVKLLEPSQVNKTQSLWYSTKRDAFDSEVLENSRQTCPTHFQDVRLIRFKTRGQHYAPGDVVVIQPKNLKWKIDQFKQVLQDNNVIIPDRTVITVSENVQKCPVPQVLKQNLTFQQLCEEYLDLFSIPRRSVFQILSQITDSELEKEKCLEFCSVQGQEDMYAYLNRPKRNIVEVLADFPHATKNLTLDVLLEIIPPIRPREFSIASSMKKHKNEIHVLVAVVKFKTKLKEERVGLASNFLAQLEVGDQVPIRIKGGCFKFPECLTVPVIMVGPGTGISPFKSYIEQVCEHSTSKNLILFYGCRYENKDFLCKDQLTQLEKENKLKLIIAFSRAQEHRVYVQDKIKEHADLVVTSLLQRGLVFVAGSLKNMPQEVRKAFIEVLVSKGNMTVDAATHYITNMEKQGRYQTECWS